MILKREVLGPIDNIAVNYHEFLFEISVCLSYKLCVYNYICMYTHKHAKTYIDPNVKHMKNVHHQLLFYLKQ